MARIFIIMGKSATGKDTIYKRLLETPELNLKTVVMYTTRPKRKAETDGVEYHFVDEEKLLAFKKQGKVIEHRTYHTIHGDWHYFTANDGQFDYEADFLMIGTLESFAQIQKYFGRETVIPIYLEVDDGIRLLRAIRREQKQDEPKYAEMCRRYLADDEDFSSEKLISNGINKKFQNLDVNICLFHVKEEIKKLSVSNSPKLLKR